MKVSYIRILGPEYMTGGLRTTSGKDMYSLAKPSLDIWKKMLVSTGGVGHSPLRAVVYRVYVEDVPSWVSVHYVRHHIGVQFYVKSQRHKGRELEPQGQLVNMMFDVNAQSLINIAKARTCNKAAKETREVMEQLRWCLISSGDQYDEMLAQVMVPPCEWYEHCYELEPCGKNRIFLDALKRNSND